MLEGCPAKPWEPDEKRINKLVFIGRNLDEDALRKAFKGCLQWTPIMYCSAPWEVEVANNCTISKSCARETTRPNGFADDVCLMFTEKLITVANILDSCSCPKSMFVWYLHLGENHTCMLRTYSVLVYDETKESMSSCSKYILLSCSKLQIATRILAPSACQSNQNVFSSITLET